MNTGSTPPPRPSFGERLALAWMAFLRALARAILILLVMAGLGLGLFYGAPRLYAKYVLPVEENTARLDDLDVNQQAFQEQATQSAADTTAHISTLEAQSTANALAISALETQVVDISGTLQESRGDMEEDLATSLERLATLEANLEELSDGSQAQAASLEALRSEVQLLKAMQLLTRSRIALAQNDLGMARQDIDLARSILVTLALSIPAHQADYLEEIINRLDKVLANIVGAPYVAASDLEAAWQMLLMGLPATAAPPPAIPQSTLAPSTHSLTATPQPSTGYPTPAPYPYPTP